jgi:hypothetical protein
MGKRKLEKLINEGKRKEKQRNKEIEQNTKAAVQKAVTSSPRLQQRGPWTAT